MKKHKLSKKSVLKNIAIGVISFGVIVVSIFLLWVSTFTIPTLDSFNQRKVTQSTKIYDRTGEIVLYDVFQNVKRTIVPLKDISPNIIKATIAIEDNNFYNHNGVQPTAFMRAIFVNISTLSFSQGGSTITQQAIKNSLLTSEKKISRKIKEWVLAYRLEKIMTKDEIIHMYLNEIPYGGSIYGVEEASNAFFNKKALETTLAEAAYLAALPKAPSYYSPYGQNKEKLDERKNLVLREMLRHKLISSSEFEEATAEEVIFKDRTTGIKAPHFVIFVKDYLEEKYGQEVLEQGGLKVITTLDYTLQEKAEEIVKRSAIENKTKFDAENAALTAVDPKTGEILVMVGSRDYFDEEIDGNFNAATAKNRQPGSTFKVFAYAAALNKGYTPSTVVFDLRTQFSTSCAPYDYSTGGNCYSPVNYDNKFRGPITFKEALAQSINVPAVKAMYLAGMKDTLELAQAMGVSNLGTIGQYGLTLVLGGGEVSLLDMTSAYSVFANEGIRNPYKFILEITDSNDKQLEKIDFTPIRVVPEQTALQITDMLSDNNARTPAFGATSLLYFPGRDVAAKTGTTNNYRDAWIIGYTPQITVGAWAGNNDNKPMNKQVAGYIIAPMWNEFMKEVLKELPNEPFKPAPQESDYTLKPVLRGQWSGGTSVLIDSLSGMRATEFTPSELIEEKLAGGVHSILYWVDKNNPRGPVPSNPANDAQFQLWEYPVREWVAYQNLTETTEESLPTEYSDNHGPEYSPSIKIEEPQNQDVRKKNDTITVLISHSGRFPIKKIDILLNNSIIGSVTAIPYVFTFKPIDIEGHYIGDNTLTVVAYDEVLNKTEKSIMFTIID